MHWHMHGFGGGRGRGLGPRGARWQRGPFSFEWSSEDWSEARGRGGRGRRVFDGGELRLVLLKLIADEVRHGYELIREIEEMTGGAYAPSPGVVYPTLSLLDEMGLIAEQRSDDSRKRYAATDAGREHLAERTEEVAALFARLEGMKPDRGAAEGGAPVWRALKNLGVAIRQRQARGGFSEGTVHDVAALIDEVAQKIERLR